ncbi:MAG: hypothetical protein IJF97_03490 [Eggerthellaceae bacterium]|nr:hypothetical protein [Eggerthellaceae bacterium]
MASFEGRWRAIARQATYGETPVRKVFSGDIADLVIEPNGRGHSFKKGLFGQKELPFTWNADEPDAGFIDLGGGLVILFVYNAPNHLMTQWMSPMKSIDGMGVLYERV